MNSQALVLDFDDTVYSEADYFEKVFSSFCREESWPSSCYQEIIENFRHYRLTKKNIFNFFLDMNGSFWKNKSKKASKETLNENLFNLYTSIKIKLDPFKGAAAVIDHAIDAGLKVGILTNGVADAQLNKWYCLELSQKSNIVFLPARNCIAEKPNPEAFKKMASLLNVSIEQTLFVGDQFEKDLAYPLSSGAWGILITGQKKEYDLSNKLYYVHDVSYIKPIINNFVNRKR